MVERAVVGCSNRTPRDSKRGVSFHRLPAKNKPLFRAVCCKDQLRSCNIEKNDFSKLCQNKGLGELVLKNISFRSFRCLFIFYNFFGISRSRRPKLKPKSGIFRKLPFNKWKRGRKDQPRKSKDLISSVYWRCKIYMKVEREFDDLF